MGRLLPVYRSFASSISSSLLRRNLFQSPQLSWYLANATASTTTTTAGSARSTVDERERAQFAKSATEWWRSRGPHAMLHEMNSIRVPFVVDALVPHSGPTGVQRLTIHQPLRGKRILDIGAGGGFLSEALARLGADVVGLEIVEEAVRVAREHAARDAVLRSGRGGKVEFRCESVEAYLRGLQRSAGKSSTPSSASLPQSVQFDAVVASEVVEHVADVERFIESLAALARPGGHLLFTTVNRTPYSFLFAIVIGEYIARLIPPGTHRWSRFIQPAELQQILERNGCEVVAVRGSKYRADKRQWVWAEHMNMNYALDAIKLSR